MIIFWPFRAYRSYFGRRCSLFSGEAFRLNPRYLFKPVFPCSMLTETTFTIIGSAYIEQVPVKIEKTIKMNLLHGGPR